VKQLTHTHTHTSDINDNGLKLTSVMSPGSPFCPCCTMEGNIRRY